MGSAEVQVPGLRRDDTVQKSSGLAVILSIRSVD